MKKRILSILLAALMVVSLLPVTAFADAPDVSTWAKLQAAINATAGDSTTPATEATTITLTDDLVANINASPTSDQAIIIPEGKKITLDLNGHVLDRGLSAFDVKGTGNAIVVKGDLTITDSNPEAVHKFKVLDNGLWVRDEANGTKTVKGGVITGGSADNDDGGGICIYGSGSLTMNGGTICGNTASGVGGGVYVGGTFTMNGGTISGNSAKEGGGVYNINGTFTMNDGTISGNATSGVGGGVYNYINTFTMNGGTISGNSAKEGGGVYNINGTFTMNDGTISGNSATEGGGLLNYGTSTVTCGEIINNTSSVDGGGIENVKGSYTNSLSLTAAAGKTITITGNKAAGNGGGILYFGGDMYLSGAVIIKDNSTDSGNCKNLAVNTVNNPVDITGALTGSVIYAADYQKTTGVLTNGYTTKSGSTELNTFFHYDGPSTNYMFINQSGELEVKEVPADSKSVSIPSITGGKITSDKQIVANSEEDRSVYLTVTPNEGYQLKEGSLKVTYMDGSLRTIYPIKMKTQGAYSFTMPKADATVTAEFEKIYSVWVGGVQVTAGDVFGDGAVTYTPDAENPDTKGTLTLNGAQIYTTLETFESCGIKSKLEDLTIVLEEGSNNQIGNAVVYDDTVEFDAYKVDTGIRGGNNSVPGDITITGDGTLTIYDRGEGIEATNVTFDESFTGTLTVEDFGSSPKCAISAGRWDYDDEGNYVCVEGGDVTINGGTFDLTSYNSNGIHANNVTVKNAESFTVNADDEVIDAYGTVTFRNCANVVLESEGDDAVYAGDILIENSTVNVVTDDNDGLDADTDENGAGSVTIKNSKVTIHAEDNGIECKTLTVEGADAEVYSVGGTDDDGGYGLRIDGGANALTIKGGSVKFTGDVAAIRVSDEAFTMSLPSGAALKGNANKDTFTDLQDITMKTVEGYKYSYVGEQVAKSAAVITPSAPVYYDDPTITVPVNGDVNSVKVQATLSGGNATIKNVTAEQIAEIGTGAEVTIDLSGLNQSVSGVTIPKTTFENIAASEADGLEVKLPNGTTAVFDKTTVAAIAEQAEGKDIKLVVDKDAKAEKSMTAAQKETVKTLNNPVALDAYFVSGGKRISDFKGGEAELTAEYPTTSPVRVWYVKDDGSKELVPSTFDGKSATFVVKHFSHYVIEELDGSSYAACPQDATCVYAKFTDADTKAWYHDGVHFCVANGIMSGVSDTQFAPSGTLSRGMIVTMLWRLEGESVVNYAMTFKDVADGQWYTEAIRWAQSTGVVEGYSAESFGPDNAVTREQLAAILYRYAQSKGEGFTGSWMFLLDFVDRASISSWADEAVHWCSMKGVVSGKDGKVFDPQGNATRAEAATMIQRFCEKIMK